MFIIIVAIAAALVTWFIFSLQDKKKNNKQTIVESTDLKISKKPESDNRYMDYEVYKLSKKEYLFSVIMAAIFLFVMGYIFYMNIAVSVGFALLSFLFPRIRSIQLRDKRKQELGLQFKQALYSLSSSLGAGRSVENSFHEVIEDLRLLYPDPNTYIIREFEIIAARLGNREPIEDLILEFSERAGLDDITSFADVFVTCKRTGGNLVEVIRRTSNIIGEKLEIQQEIRVMISQKKFESKALSLTPVLIVGFLGFSAPDYMKPMYSLPGYAVISVCVVALGLCYWVTTKIMNIKV